MDENAVICPCLDLTAADLKEAVKNGASTVDEILEKTGAGSVCGACMDEVKEISQKLLEA